jgi:hypothetical protein
MMRNNLVYAIGIALLVFLSSCIQSTDVPLQVTPTLEWQPLPTYSFIVPPSNKTEYVHYVPSENFQIRLEFDYPSYWWLEEYIDEIGSVNLLLRDPRFVDLPTPTDNSMHPAPNDLGFVTIWIMLHESGQTPESELQSHKLDYSQIPRMKVLDDYKIKLDGEDAHVLEYLVDDPETSPSVMFYKRIYFAVNDRVYEIIYSVAEKDRGGEFDKGFDYLLKSLKITP